MNPTDPRTLDPYRYANSNPVSYQDASGLCSGLTGDALDRCSRGGGFGEQYAIEYNANHPSEGTSGGGTSGGSGASAPPTGATPPNPPGHFDVKLPTDGVFDWEWVDDAAQQCFRHFEGTGPGAYRSCHDQATKGLIAGAIDSGPFLNGSFTFYYDGGSYEYIPSAVAVWWQEHGDSVLNVLDYVVMGVCFIVSSGACLAATAVLITATAADGEANRGWDDGDVAWYVGWSAATHALGMHIDGVNAALNGGTSPLVSRITTTVVVDGAGKLMTDVCDFVTDTGEGPCS